VTHPQVQPDPAFGLLKLYDDALPHVYGYLLARCGDTGLAEDLTAESFLAAVHAVRKPGAPDPSIPWLIGVARHKIWEYDAKTLANDLSAHLAYGAGTGTTFWLITKIWR